MIIQSKERLKKSLIIGNKALKNNNKVKIEDNKLIISPITAEDIPESSKQLKTLISKQIPKVDISNLLIEVDNWSNFTEQFEHVGGSKIRKKDFLLYLYAAIISQACNFDLARMADASGLSYDQLLWTTNLYLREDTLQAAINCLVNYHFHQPISRYWGGGTLSSSDGQNFPMGVKARNAVHLPKYFAYGKGITFYSWTSDQFSQYGSKVIPATIRDATYVLDAILDNETELEIMEHTTDTAGYTEIVFALFDLLGMQFSPRIKDIGDQKLYRDDKMARYDYIEPILKGTINFELISKKWEDILRLIASIKFGWVTASLFISKLKSYPRQNILAKAIQEYGCLAKTDFILKYAASEENIRRILVQLNKGEALHALRAFLSFANEKIQKSQLDEQANQASCLTLLTNAVIIWNTRYIQEIISQLKIDGHNIYDEDIEHLSPCRFEHINKYGRYNFNVDEELNRQGLRPIRKP